LRRQSQFTPEARALSSWVDPAWWRVDAAVDHQAAISERGATGGKKLKGVGIGFVLDLEDAGGKAGFIIARQHGHHTLNEDGTIIEFGAHQMDAAAMDTNPGFERARMGVQAFEGRQKRGVDIQKPVFPAFHEPRRQNTHEASETDKFDASLIQSLIQGLIKRFPTIKGFVINDQARNAGRPSNPKPASTRPIAHNKLDLKVSVWPLASDESA